MSTVQAGLQTWEGQEEGPDPEVRGPEASMGRGGGTPGLLPIG